MRSTHFLMRVACGLLALLGSVSLAHAEDLRGCTEAELGVASLAPMPKDLSALNDFGTDKVRLAGYLLTIDAQGIPTIVCAIDVMTDSKIRDRAAEAVSKLVYWPPDATPPGKLAYIHIQSQGYGLTIPSVLPRATDPICDGTMQGGPNGEEPIYRAQPLYTRQNIRDGWEGDVTIIVRVLETGAAVLFCRAAGQNIERFEAPAYYAAAGWRFAAKPGRPPFEYTITFQYRIR